MVTRFFPLQTFLARLVSALEAFDGMEGAARLARATGNAADEQGQGACVRRARKGEAAAARLRDADVDALVHETSVVAAFA